jgi:hypothetical protein
MAVCWLYYIHMAARAVAPRNNACKDPSRKWSAVEQK